MMMRVAVIIPARDEEALIGRCLTSVLEAARHADAHVSVIVAADGCLDRTAEIAHSFPGVIVLDLQSSNVGAARAAAADLALHRGTDWLANTDADSVVPPNWLVDQLHHASRGIDVVIGTVRPELDELTDEQLRAWRATHVVGEPNGHVHGANLGIRASAYRDAGGYLALPEHEDVDLVARLAGHPMAASDTAEVVTSSRRFGRTPGGYARYLRELVVDAPVRGLARPPITRTHS